MCCIKYENDVYTENRRQLPKIGSFVKTKEDGRVRVTNINIIEKTVKVSTKEDGVKTYNVDELLLIEEFDKKPAQQQGE